MGQGLTALARCDRQKKIPALEPVYDGSSNMYDWGEKWLTFVMGGVIINSCYQQVPKQEAKNDLLSDWNL